MQSHLSLKHTISAAIIARCLVLILAVAVLAVSVACSAGAATPTPAPEFTTAPSPADTAAPPPPSAQPPVDMKTNAVDAFAVLEEFLEKLPRASATAQELAAAEYLQSRFQDLGYTADLQTFTVEDISLAGMGLTLHTPNTKEFAAIPMAGTGLGEVSGVLTPVGLAMPGDIPADGLEDRIALAERGIIPFQQKAENVFEAGAVGLVVYNNVSGLFQGVLSTQPEFPVIALSREDGEAIEALLLESEIEASIGLTLQDVPSRNVIAEKQGPGEAVVVLGGHYDSIPEVSGANDNGSGAAVLLAISENLSDVDLPFTLRIIAFGSEELGLLGSQFYVDTLNQEELDRIKIMLNFDAVGAGTGVSVFGDRELTALAAAVGDEIGEQIAVTLGISGGSSDFAPFQAAGVPFMMFFGDDFSRIHSASDTIQFVQPEIVNGAAEIAAALLQSEEFGKLINID